MGSFFKAKNKTEAVSQIWERLSLVPDELKTAVLDAIIYYTKDRRTLRKYPMSVKCHTQKPSFDLSDGDVMYAFALKKQGPLTVATERKYCGSADSVLWHQTEQLSSGQLAPSGQVGVFVIECASSGGNRYWMVDVWVGTQTSVDVSNKEQIKAPENRYYVDEDNGVFCVFDSVEEPHKAVASYANKPEAEQLCHEKNRSAISLGGNK